MYTCPADVDYSTRADMACTTLSPSHDIVHDAIKLSPGVNGLPNNTSQLIGFHNRNIGDLDGDGIDDLAVSVTTDDTGGTNRGAVIINFMNADGTVRSSHQIDDSDPVLNAGLALVDGDGFGVGVDTV
ncbi:MAG: hypothetical protein H6546_07050 [Chitinophagales bacterium]|nr:hypothetical protein [Chitinophagales bacterium]